MKSLKRLIDFLPYYFRGNDTYKDNNGKGLLERYLEIFGNYFEDIIVEDIKSLNDILDISKTDDIYLGYLWEFLGQLPYANPNSIDPNKWKAYFNGLDDSTTIARLSKYWLYPKDTVSGDLVLNESTVRNLLIYSVTLFKIRGTEKFFKTLMALYGLDIDILESQSSPTTKGVHGDDYDYAGKLNPGYDDDGDGVTGEDGDDDDEDYGGNDEDYGGSVEYYKKIHSTPKLDGNGVTLNNGCTMDSTSVCNTCASIHFRLYIPTNIYTKNHVDQYIEKVENIIKRFLPINVRPVFEWITPSGDVYRVTNSMVLRPFVLVDTLPNSESIPAFYTVSGLKVSNVFQPFDMIDGWYLYLPDTLANMNYMANGTGTYSNVHTELSELSWLIGTKLRVMVLILPVNSSGVPTGVKVDEELNPIRFTINNGDVEYESGHIFNLTIGPGKTPVDIEPKPVLLDDYWRPWYTHNYQVYFNNKLKRVSYKFGVDYNSTVITSFDYGEHGSIPVASYKEVATLVNGNIIDTVSSPVDFMWNGVVKTPLPVENDPTRYRLTVNPTSSGEQLFSMVENPARSFIVITKVNRLLTKVIPSPSISQINIENPTIDSRLDVKLGNGDLKVPNTLPGYEVGVQYSSWFNDNVTVVEDRGLSDSYYHGTFTVNNLNNIDRYTQLGLLIPILGKPIHNSSQNLVVTCNGTIGDGEQVVLKTYINLLTQTINFIQINDDGSKYTGVASFYGKIDKLINNTLVSIGDAEGYDYDGYKVKYINLSIGALAKGVITLAGSYIITPTSLSFEVDTLSYSDLVVRNISNLNNVYNAGELVKFSRSGIYEFKAGYVNDLYFTIVNATVGILDITGSFNSGIKYSLDIIDQDYIDNRANTIRIPYRFENRDSTKATIRLNLSLFTNLNQVDGTDMEAQFPNYFDWDIEIRLGSNPMGALLKTVHLLELDPDAENYNIREDQYTGELIPAENYGRSGVVELPFNKIVEKDGEGRIISIGDRDYNPSPDPLNLPPNLYTVMMHSRTPMDNQPYYQVIELYEDRDPNERQVHIDVDVISRAWLNPVGINGDIDTRKTWGYYKSHLETMVTDASYDVHIEVPEFRVLLSNNNIGYKKVWLYKSLPSNSFDSDDTLDALNSKDIIYQPTTGESDIKSPGEGRYWVFTGTVYDIGDLVKGPEEPGMYMLLVHQTSSDKITIGKAYLEVKEIANYILTINPTAAILEEEDTAVSTEINVTHDAIWPKKLRLWSVNEDRWLNLNGSGNTAQTLFPVTFLAYTAGVYDFTVYGYNEENGEWEVLYGSLGALSGTFNVLRNTTLSPESRVWAWDGTVPLRVDLVMVNADRNIPWTATISEDQ